MATTTASDDLIEFLRTLRAVRRFTPDPVPEAVLGNVLNVARWSGSAMNKQPWEFVVVRDRDTLRKLAEAYPNAGHLADAAVAIVLVMAGGWPSGEAYDEGRLTERILLAAKAEGLGAAIGWLGSDGVAAAAKQILGIPEGRFVRTAVALGYPAPEPTRSSRSQARKPLAEIVHTDRYGRRGLSAND